MKLAITNIRHSQENGNSQYDITIHAMTDEWMEQMTKRVGLLAMFTGKSSEVALNEVSVDLLSPEVQDHLYTQLMAAIEARQS